MHNLEPRPERDAGTEPLRLLAFPQVVLFPNILLPVRVGVARECRLVEEALAADRLVAVGIRRPNPKPDDSASTSIADDVETCGCLGKIVAHHRDDQDAYHLMLSGLCRVRFLRTRGPEPCPDATLRTGGMVDARIVEDEYPRDMESHAARLSHAVLLGLSERIELTPPPSVSPSPTALTAALPADYTLGALTDIGAHLLDLAREEKLAFLSECNVIRRARHLLDLLDAGSRPSDGLSFHFWTDAYPPDFTPN